jgi:hypothetical protein
VCSGVSWQQFAKNSPTKTFEWRKRFLSDGCRRIRCQLDNPGLDHRSLGDPLRAGKLFALAAVEIDIAVCCSKFMGFARCTSRRPRRG